MTAKFGLIVIADLLSFSMLTASLMDLRTQVRRISVHHGELPADSIVFSELRVTS